MQKLIDNTIVKEDINDVCCVDFINWQEFKNKTILITGITGLVGSFLANCFAKANGEYDLNLKIIGLVRDKKKAENFFKKNIKKRIIKIQKCDLTKKIKYNGKIDYIIHCAGNTESKSFTQNPVETLEIMIEGTKNVLELAKEKQVRSIVYLSSMEVYGQTDTTCQKEEDIGYLDILNIRSSYPVGKRTAETMCHSYYKENNVPVKIIRLAQIIGANANIDDERLFGYLARCVVNNENIVLKTKGDSIRSFCYVTDAITGILTVLLKGKNGEAYNNNNNISLQVREFAEIMANKGSNTNLEFDIKDNEIYPPTTNWNLDNSKLKSLGWHCVVPLDKALDKLIDSFYKQKNEWINLNDKTHLHKILENVFSIKNTRRHKIIKLAGIKLKIKLADINKIKIGLLQKIKGIDSNKIVIFDLMSSGYGCNPKYILEEIKKRKLPYKIVWVFKTDSEDKSNFDENTKLVYYYTTDAIKEFATAKIWIGNYHLTSLVARGIVKNKKTKYIQLWHGALGIKTINADMPEYKTNPDAKWLTELRKDSELTDYWISNSKFETGVYKSSWMINEDCFYKIKELGHPRNDLFFVDDHKKNKDKVSNILGIDADKKLLLYVPTFRKNFTLSQYLFDYKKVIEIAKQKFGGDFIFLLRLHSKMSKYIDKFLDNNEYICNATYYPDIQELLAASDVVISDYSSCMFDFMLTRKPVFILASDLEDYKKDDRGFYYPIETTPFPIAINCDELINNILNFDNEKYIKDVEQFLKDKGCIDDGHASERVVDLIEGIIKSNE